MNDRFIIGPGGVRAPRRYPYYTMTMLAEDIAREQNVPMPIAVLMSEGFDRTGAEAEYARRVATGYTV